jgi:hypothetical protein
VARREGRREGAQWKCGSRVNGSVINKWSADRHHSADDQLRTSGSCAIGAKARREGAQWKCGSRVNGSVINKWSADKHHSANDQLRTSGSCAIGAKHYCEHYNNA